MSRSVPITANHILDTIDTQVAWERGPDHAFEDDAIIGGQFLEALARLAARAPGSEKRKFLKEWNRGQAT